MSNQIIIDLAERYSESDAERAEVINKINNPVSVGKRIGNLRKEYMLTLRYVSSECNISLSYLSDIEHGRCFPSLEVAERIAIFYGMNLSELLRDVVINS